MNGYSTLLHNIAPGKYIAIKVEYGLQLHFNRAYPGSEFVVANTLANGKSWSQMKLTLAKVLTLSPLCLLIAFANSLDPDQGQQNVGPDLDPNCLTPGWF